jgi:hypothetical protein
MKNSNPTKGRKKYNPYKLYIPENLNIDELILKYPLPLGIHKDQLVYILHLINSIPANINDFDFIRNRGFTPINKTALINRIHEYRKCLNYLIAYDIIEEGTSYIPGLYSKGIKFKPQYRAKVRPIWITKATLIKSITTRNYKTDSIAMEKLSFLKDNFNSKLTIDIEAVKNYLENDIENEKRKYELNKKRCNYHSIDEIVMMGYNAKLINASNLNKKDKVKIDTTTGRLHSSLVRLKKELRLFVKYDNKLLCNIDLVNSQPLLSIILLDINLFMLNDIHALIAKYNPIFYTRTWYNNSSIIKEHKFHNNPAINLIRLIKHNSKKSDVKTFKKHILNGTFYEAFGNILKEKNLLPNDIMDISEETSRNKAIRRFAKKAVFESFFSKPASYKWSPSIRAFKECFPHVYQIFSAVKQGKGEHNTLACVLQRFESDMILHKVCLKIHHFYPSVLLYTIHDSLVTTIENQQIVRDIFIKTVAELLNTEPIIQIDLWSS